MRKIISLSLLGILVLVGCASKPEKKIKYITLSQGKVKTIPAGREIPLSPNNDCPSKCANDVASVYEVTTNDKNEKKCVMKFSYPCAPFGCDAQNYTCKASCQNSDECSAGSACHSTQHQCVTIGTAVCKDQWTLVAPDGSEMDCGGYRCMLTQCAQSCREDKECSKGFECIKNHCKPD